MKITTIGINLVKEVFQIHGVDMRGKTVLRKQLRRSDMARFFANLDPCLIKALSKPEPRRQIRCAVYSLNLVL
ncbi:hypothetical protein C8R34_1484 [Nitrosomonas sp. Nm84]|nr:hypothetical protein C8R34_1484 [Nitrosomonas sp. Nm84]